MKIIADIDIPFVKNYFESYGELVLKPGRLIEHSDLKDADLLLVRSVTRVDKNLLHQTAVKFVGSVATGIDHLDTAWLDQAGIQWRAASGYNAIAVSDYIISVLAALFQGLPAVPVLRAGIIGVGHVGSHVDQRFKSLGFKTFLCDPPRAELEKDFNSTALSALADVDLVTVHTPLTRTGKHPSYHLIDEAFLNAASKNSILINASRGSVVDFAALKSAKTQWQYCFDVWENEPQIDLAILEAACIATPHLAGHSLQSRHRGVDRVYRAACEAKILEPKKLALPAFPQQTLSFGDRWMKWQEVVLAIFDPLATSLVMKNALLKESLKCATLFDELRQQYIGNNIKRHEFGFTTITRVCLTEKDRHLLTQFGITIR